MALTIVTYFGPKYTIDTYHINTQLSFEFVVFYNTNSFLQYKLVYNKIQIMIFFSNLEQNIATGHNCATKSFCLGHAVCRIEEYHVRMKC